MEVYLWETHCCLCWLSSKNRLPVASNNIRSMTANNALDSSPTSVLHASFHASLPPSIHPSLPPSVCPSTRLSLFLLRPTRSDSQSLLLPPPPFPLSPPPSLPPPVRLSVHLPVSPSLHSSFYSPLIVRLSLCSVIPLLPFHIAHSPNTTPPSSISLLLLLSLLPF